MVQHTNLPSTKFFGRPVADRISFNCPDAVPIRETLVLDRTSCSDGLRPQLHFRIAGMAWSCTNLTSHTLLICRKIDNGICPPTHPVQIPHLFYEVLYGVNDIDTSDGSQFVLSTMISINGWDPTVQTNTVANCLKMPDKLAPATLLLRPTPKHVAQTVLQCLGYPMGHPLEMLSSLPQRNGESQYQPDLSGLIAN